MNTKKEKHTIELLNRTQTLLSKEYPSIGAMLSSIANAIQRGDEGFLVSLNSCLGPWSRKTPPKKKEDKK